MLRQIVDPAGFSFEFVPPPSATTELTSTELATLMSGLNVRIRAMAQGFAKRGPQRPGPADYVRPSALSSIGPRWRPANDLLSEQDRAAKLLPGPGEYAPRPPTSTRRYLMTSRLADVSAASEPRRPHPGPGSYDMPALPTHAWRIRDRDALRAPSSADPLPAPGQYSALRSTFEPRPGNSSQSPRFPAKAIVAPGPGAYSIEGMRPVQTEFSARRCQMH